MTREELLRIAKPILFNTEMVRSVKDNRKTATRRVVLPQPNHEIYWKGGTSYFEKIPCDEGWYGKQLQPQYGYGDILYVRETFYPFDSDHVIDGVKYAYKADASPKSECTRKDLGYKWHPSIHMPKEAARLFLLVTDVKGQRLQDITEEQAKAEGAVKAYPYINPITGKTVFFVKSDDGTYLAGFKYLWNECYAAPRGVKNGHGVITHYESFPFEEIRETRTYKGKPWYVIGNPWVWDYEFERTVGK